MNDAMKGLEATLAEMDQLGDLMSIQPRAAEGKDDQGVVTAQVDAEQRLKSITVANRWQEKVEPEDLAGAVKAAIGQAVAASMSGDKDTDELAEDRAAKDAEAARTRSERAEQMFAEQQARFESLIPTSQEQLEAMVEQIHQMMGMMDQLTEQLSDRVENGSRVEYFNETRRASIAYKAGFPVEVTLDKNWVKNQSGMTLTTIFTEILEQASDQRQALPVGDDRLKAFGL